MYKITKLLTILFAVLLIAVGCSKKEEPTPSTQNDTEEEVKISLKEKASSNYITSARKNVETSSKKDKDVYSSYVITDKVTSFDTSDGKKIRIDGNKLYVNDEKIDTNVKFKTLYNKVIKTVDGAQYVFLISTNGELYALKLDNLLLPKISTKKKVTNFTSARFNGDTNNSNVVSYVFVLQNDGNFYDVFSNIRYDENIKMMNNGVLVYNDNTVSNMSGFMFEDKSGNYYKIKYSFFAEDKEFGKVTYIVTDNNKLVFGFEKELYMMIYESKSNLSNLSFNKNTSELSFKLGAEDITIEKASCKEYCPN